LATVSPAHPKVADRFDDAARCAFGPAEVLSVTAGLGQAPSVLSCRAARLDRGGPENHARRGDVAGHHLGAPHKFAPDPNTLFSEMTLATWPAAPFGGTPIRDVRAQLGSISRSRHLDGHFVEGPGT